MVLRGSGKPVPNKLIADEGGIGSGVRRDWLNSMMNSMLDPQTGLFESCDGGHTWQPCPLAHMQEEHLVYFEMLGELFFYLAGLHVTGHMPPQAAVLSCIYLGCSSR